jgi:hypothetical protein
MHCPHFIDDNGPHGTRQACTGVKDAPSQLALPDALVGRFLPGSDETPQDRPVRLSRRARARQRQTTQ